MNAKFLPIYFERKALDLEINCINFLVVVDSWVLFTMTYSN